VPAPVAARRKGRARLAWVFAGVAAAAAVVFGVGYFSHRPAKAEQIRFLISAPEGITFIDSPRISPDGRYVAFNMTDSTGVTRIWVRAMNALAAQPMMGTEGAARPFWSPDSKFIGFMADNKLKKVAVTGGPAVTVCESGSRGDGAWGRSGVILFDGSAADSIARVSASGGVPSPATTLDRGRRETGNAWPEFLPDGKHFLFLAFGSKAESVAVKVGSIDSKEMKILAIGNYSRIDFAPPGYILFVRDRALMAQPFDGKALKLTGEPFPVVDDVSAGGGGASNADFSVSDNGVLVCRGGVGSGNSRLVWIDRTGKVLGTLGAPADYATISISPDGERVAAEIGQLGAGVDIWVLDRTRGVTTRLTFDPGDDIWPVWSHDGTRITFASNRDGDFGIYGKQSNGVGADDSLLRTSDNAGPSDWSSDGRYLVYLSSAPVTRWDIWALPTFGDKKPIAFLKTQFSEFEARLSPDGRWLAYSSSESGRREIYVQAFPDAGGKWQISTQGGRDPMWRRDGKELFYISPDGRMLSVDIAAGATFQAGVPKALFDGVRSNDNQLGRSYAVTADGQQFLVIRPDRARAIPATTVVVNWSAGFQEK
jgi:WD40 repeat protein